MKKLIIIFAILLLTSCSYSLRVEQNLSMSENFKYEYAIETPSDSLAFDSTMFFTQKLFDKDDQIIFKKRVTDNYSKIIILSNKEYFNERHSK